MLHQIYNKNMNLLKELRNNSKQLHRRFDIKLWVLHIRKNIRNSITDLFYTPLSINSNLYDSDFLS